jgi:hypothetical protein
MKSDMHLKSMKIQSSLGKIFPASCVCVQLCAALKYITYSKFVVLFSAALLQVSAEIKSAKERLTRDLLRDYQISVDSTPTNLKFGIEALCFRFDKFTGIVTGNVVEYMVRRVCFPIPNDFNDKSLFVLCVPLYALV